MSSFKKANILLPKNIDMTKWSVVACDQFTSEPDYWNEVSEIAKDSYSTLNLIYPEIYLSEGDKRIKAINESMQKYIDDKIFAEFSDTLIYLERRLDSGKVRRGIIGAIDLEDYSFQKGSGSNVRATEGTVLERIPPRVKIRENAPMEFPHIMILIDDPEKNIIEPLQTKTKAFEKLYDFDLMQKGGHAAGYKISDSDADEILEKLDLLSSEEIFNAKYNIKNAPLLTFAVGDGNHSLATAKTCWENIKANLSEEEQKTHPARYALVELVNLHDDSLEFEPIHRVVFDVNPEEMYASLLKFYPESSENDNGGKMIICTWGNVEKKVWIKDSNNNLVVGSVQDFIDSYLKENGGSVDYIHGDAVVRDLSSKENNFGVLLPAMEKSELFKTVILDGALPRKTFSMGEACEKRYYIEGKYI